MVMTSQGISSWDLCRQRRHKGIRASPADFKGIGGPLRASCLVGTNLRANEPQCTISRSGFNCILSKARKIFMWVNIFILLKIGVDQGVF